MDKDIVTRTELLDALDRVADRFDAPEYDDGLRAAAQVVRALVGELTND